MKQYRVLLAAYQLPALYRVKAQLRTLDRWHSCTPDLLPRDVAEPVAGIEHESMLYTCRMHFTADFVADLSWQQYLRAICWPQAVDFFCIEQNLWEQHKYLAVFDMDATLIKNEVIDELAAEHQVGHKVAGITERAMRGERDFNTSIRARVDLLKGLSVASFAHVQQRIKPQNGLYTLFDRLQQSQIKTAIFSGGFTVFAQSLADQLQVDHLHANQLETDAKGYLTGRLSGKIVNAAYKAVLLQQLIQQYNIKPAQTIAVGDGANDIPMLQTAGIGIAFHAKLKVKEQVLHAIDHTDLRSIGALL